MPRRAWTAEDQKRRKERRAARKLAQDPNWTPEKSMDAGRRKGRIVNVNFGTDEQMADAFVETNDPFSTIAAAAKKVGLPEGVIKALRGRLRARFQPLGEALRERTTKDFLSAIEDRLDRALHYLDDYALAAASAKDLAVTIGILTEKRQLLRGEPTQILSNEERTTINMLIPVVIREAQRRGITIDMNGGGEPRVLGGRSLIQGVPREIIGEH